MLTHTLIAFHTLTVEEYFVVTSCLLSSYSACVCRCSPEFGVKLNRLFHIFHIDFRKRYDFYTNKV